MSYNRRFAGNYFFSANYTLSRLYGNYAGLASSDEVTTPTTGGCSATAQQQAGSISRPGGNVNRVWDSDELLFDSRGNLDVLGRLATDRPHALKMYGAYDFASGTQIGAFFYAASGTPMSTLVTSTHSADLLVFGRGDMGRTPLLNRTDLMLSQEVPVGGTKRMRFELNVTNLFNQKTTRHVYNYLNKGGIIPDRASSYIDLSSTDLTKGYNPDALIRATTDGANAFDPRYEHGGPLQRRNAGVLHGEVPVLVTTPPASLTLAGNYTEERGASGSPFFCQRAATFCQPIRCRRARSTAHPGHRARSVRSVRVGVHARSRTAA